MTWCYNNKELKDAGRYRIRTTKQGKIYVLVLDMSGVTNQDMGSYQLVAENEKGKASSTISVNFEGNLQFFSVILYLSSAFSIWEKLSQCFTGMQIIY